MIVCEDDGPECLSIDKACFEDQLVGTNEGKLFYIVGMVHLISFWN